MKSLESYLRDNRVGRAFVERGWLADDIRAASADEVNQFVATWPVELQRDYNAAIWSLRIIADVP